MSWAWPLPGIARATSPEGAFGVVRKHDIHTGIDLYAPENATVVAVEAGRIVNVVPFTGALAESPWWLDTSAVLVEGASGVVCYGEVWPRYPCVVGAGIAAGERIGRVQRVLRVDKGRPMSMLHLELYEAGTREPIWWPLGVERSPILLDPTPFLPETP